MPLTITDKNDQREVALAKPTDELRAFIDKHIPVSSFMPWSRRSWPGSTMSKLAYATGFFPDPPFKLNVLRWPTGATRWGYGHFLASENQVDQISQYAYAADGTHNMIYLNMGTPGLQGGEANIKFSVYMLQPTPLSPILADPNANSLFLITLVDERYFWWYKDTDKNITINKTNYATNGWQYLFKTCIENQLGFTSTQYNIKTPSNDYLYPSPDLVMSYGPLPQYIDALCLNTNRRLTLEYDTGKDQVMVKVLDRDDSMDSLNANIVDNQFRTVRAGWQRFPESFGPQTPFFNLTPSPNVFCGIQGIRMSFKPMKCLGSHAGLIPTEYKVDWDNPAIDVPLAAYRLEIDNTCFAKYTPGPDPSALTPVNSASLNTLATTFGTDFAKWRQTTFDIVFNGIVNIKPNGLIDTIEFSFQDDDATTRIYSYPWNYEVNQLNHYDWANACERVNNVFMSSTSIAPGGSSVVQTRGRKTDDSGWTETGYSTVTVYNPAINGTFAGGTQGTWIEDQDGNCVIVQQDCP